MNQLYNQYLLLDLKEFLNNKGISKIGSAGEFDSWGNSFDAAELPEPGELFEINEIPFRISKNSYADNMVLENQVIPLQYEFKCNCINILGASDGGNFFDSIKIEFSNGNKHEYPVGVSWWKSNEAHFGNKVGMSCQHLINSSGEINKKFQVKLWHCTVVISNEFIPVSLTFPDNVCMHVFAITMEI